METKEKTEKKMAGKGKQKKLRVLRIEKGYHTLTKFAEEVAKHMKKPVKNVQSALSRFETLTGKPNQEYGDAISAVLGLDDATQKSLNKSFGRAGLAKKKKAKKRKAAVRRKNADRPARKAPVVTATMLTTTKAKEGIVTPEIAKQFAAAVAGAEGVSLEIAVKLLQEKTQ